MVIKEIQEDVSVAIKTKFNKFGFKASNYFG